MVQDIAIRGESPGSITDPIESDKEWPTARHWLLRFFEGVLSRRYAVKMDPATRCRLQRNTSSMMKIRFFIYDSFVSLPTKFP